MEKEDPDRIITQHELARAYLKDGQIPEAIKLFEHVVAIRKRTLEEGHALEVIVFQPVLPLAGCYAVSAVRDGGVQSRRRTESRRGESCHDRIHLLK